jgi:TatD DNase family protein
MEEKLISFVDTHSHLALLEHTSPEQALTRARLAGVTKLLTVSTEESNWEPNRRLAESHEGVYYTLGLHPHDAHTWTECGGKLFERFSPFPKVPEKCVAIGEMGLDFYYDFCPKDVQIHAFESQLAFAGQVDLPVVIHCRDAFDILFDSIKKIGLGRRSGVLHCFTGTSQEARTALDMGLKISFSGIVTFKNSASLREAAKTIPLTEMLIETDCPYLAPMPHRGKPNEPSFLPDTAKSLAATLGCSVEEIAEQTSLNAIEFFQLA